MTFANYRGSRTHPSPRNVSGTAVSLVGHVHPVIPAQAGMTAQAHLRKSAIITIWIAYTTQKVPAPPTGVGARAALNCRGTRSLVSQFAACAVVLREE